ncbi:hypothetical protein JKP88DRAFT_294291 [Tribonema minus]|uniref:Sulfotransferase n=1 Tax=Tribonema minus TaxID=303371 RepID=A0A835ZE24_9STRA|nr:hypothetical protein JKP88DRAFT_294291 [Tribonema minus]
MSSSPGGSKRYLLWTRNLQDFGAGHSHKWFSLSCALWEAYSLNRTLVLDTFVGMNNTESLKKLPAGGMLYHDFLQDCGKPGILRQPQSIYGYQICHRSDTPDSMGFVNEPGVDYNLPKEFRYPNLDHETSPAGILETIQQHVPHGSTLYIATNEPDPVTFFKPLEEHYVLQSLAHLTDVLDSSQFLRSTLGVVDYTILDRCPMMIPTFRTEKSRGFDTVLSLRAAAVAMPDSGCGIAHGSYTMLQGRSGSSMVGTLFSSPDWAYYFEPLADAWPKLEAQFEMEAEAMKSGAPPVVYCSAHSPNRCTAATIALVLEILACQLSTRPVELLLREIAAAAAAPKPPLGKWTGKRDHTYSTANAADFLLTSGLFEAGPRPLPSLFMAAEPLSPFEQLPSRTQAEKRLSQCQSKRGVAAKIIRMTGRLGELYAATDALGAQLDLVIQLVRDPRAVLASRYSIGWSHPVARSYNATRAWAASACGDIMYDHVNSTQRPEYMLLRYEDLAGNAEKHARDIYAKMGISTPEYVLRLTRIYDGCVSGTHTQVLNCKKERARLMGNRSVDGYDTAPRNFTAQLEKWTRTLRADEIRAVEEGCADLFRVLYADAQLLSSGA